MKNHHTVQVIVKGKAAFRIMGVFEQACMFPYRDQEVRSQWKKKKKKKHHTEAVHCDEEECSGRGDVNGTTPLRL